MSLCELRNVEHVDEALAVAAERAAPMCVSEVAPMQLQLA